NRDDWQMFNQIVASLPTDAQPNSARSGSNITFGPTASNSFHLTMMDQDTLPAPVVVSNETVNIANLGGPAGGSINVGTLTAQTVGSQATFQNLQIFKSSYFQPYRINGLFTNPDVANTLTQTPSDFFRVFPFFFQIDPAKTSLTFVPINSKGFVTRIVKTARGNLRLFFPVKKAIKQGLVNQISVNVFDSTGGGAELATSYDGPVDLRLGSGVWTTVGVVDLSLFFSQGATLNTIVQKFVPFGVGAVTFKNVAPTGKIGKFQV